METIEMIQKAATMGNWWLATSSWQCAHSCITRPAEFFEKTSNHPCDSVPLQPRYGTLWLLAFPKTKITFERKEISDCCWDSGKYDGATDGDWENCVRSSGAYFEGVIVLCTFLVSGTFFNKCLYFSYYIAEYFWTDLVFPFHASHHCLHSGVHCFGEIYCSNCLTGLCL